MKLGTLWFATFLWRDKPASRSKSLLFGLAAAVVLGFSTVANAITTAPFTLYYSATPNGGLYQYDFSLVLDNNDGSWAVGQQFNWFVIGDAKLSPSPFAATFFVFTSLPPFTTASVTGGFHNGPTICYLNCINGGYQPSALGQMLNFNGFSPTFLGQGELLWSRLVADARFSNEFLVANLITPIPAALPLFATGLGALGLMGWRRKRNQNFSACKNVR